MSSYDSSCELTARFSNIDRKLETLQGHHMRSAQIAGYSRERMRRSRDAWLCVAGNPQVTGIDAVMPSNIAYLESYENELDRLCAGAERSQVELRILAGSAGTYASSTAAFIDSSFLDSSFMAGDSEQPQETLVEETDYYGKLYALSPSLARTYKAIDEVLYGTQSDPARAGMFLIRQATDQLLECLAPGDKVRASSYWRTKTKNESDDEKAIWRRERLEYAAHTHVGNNQRATTLLAETTLFLETYRLLNEAHDRGELDYSKCVNAINTMKGLLQDWVLSIET